MSYKTGARVSTGERKMGMKRWFCLCLGILLLLNGTACRSNLSAWQEQYDLGVRYLSEGNYEEAIIAFEATIKIDPTKPESYLLLADIYVETGYYESAISILEDGYKITNDDSLYERLSGLQNDAFIRSDAFKPANLLTVSGENILSEFLSLMKSNDIEATAERCRDFTWVANFSGIDGTTENANHGEFRTIYKGYKVELSWGMGDTQNYSIEFRPHEGDAYYFSIFLGEAPYEVRHFCKGQSSGWNWNGDFTHTERMVMGSGTIEEVKSSGQVIDGLLDGEVFIKESNDTYDVWTPEYYQMFDNGKIVFTQDNIFPDRFNIAYVYDQSGQKDYRSSTDNPAEWSNWVSSYRTGAHESSGEEDLLWN